MVIFAELPLYEHRPSRQMQHVDAWSRIHNILVLEGNTIEQTLAIKQNSDPDISAIRDFLENHPLFELRNGLVYRTVKGKLYIYVPSSMIINIMHTYHNEMGYFAFCKTHELFSRTYGFPTRRKKIRSYIELFS